MATVLGRQILTRYDQGAAGVPHLDQALIREWITQDEYDRAIAGLPPEDELPMPQRAAVADESIVLTSTPGSGPTEGAS